jgi:hypothetical protein
MVLKFVDIEPMIIPCSLHLLLFDIAVQQTIL